MPERKRRVWTVVLLVVLLLIAVNIMLVLWLNLSSCNVFAVWKNSRRIQRGMAKEKVEVILGGPPVTTAYEYKPACFGSITDLSPGQPVGKTECFWGGGETMIIVEFSEDGKVLWWKACWIPTRRFSLKIDWGG